MRQRLILCAFAALASALPALADPAADEVAIRSRLADWTAAFNARDAGGACDLFAPDLIYAVPDIPQGSRDGMCGNLAALMARQDLTVRYDPPAIHEVQVDGDMAMVRLTWAMTTTAKGETEAITEEGIDIFRRQPDGRWSIARFIAFTNSPVQ